MSERLVGVTLPTGHDYSPWQVGMGECYPDVMVGDLGGAEGIYDAGALPAIHLMFKKPTAPTATIQNIAAGMFDTELEAWLNTLKAYCDTGRKAVVVYLPELNGNWCVYANDDWSPESFTQAWRNFHTMADSVGLDGSMVKFCWAPNQPGWGTLEDWYPGDNWVDIIGGSLYNWGGIFDGEPWESPADIIDPYVTEIRGFTDKPIVATQIGSGLNDSRTPQWLDDLVSYTNIWTNIEGFIWYNEGPFEYGPGREAFNDQTQVLVDERPDHWFKEDTVPQHTSMLWLPDALRDLGINVIELDGWKEAQGTYFWTKLGQAQPSSSDPDAYKGDPTCFMVHHTAGDTAVPVVRNWAGTWSKANCWAGLWRDGRLYQSGSGVPTIVFTSAGPARISSGYGHGPTLYAVARDERVPWDQLHADTDMAANRYAWNCETVAEGDGSDVDPGVEEALAQMGALLAEHYDWGPYRTIGHLTWTVRKVDPWWCQLRDVIVRIQDRVAEIMDAQTAPIPPPPPIIPPPEEPFMDIGRNVEYVKQGQAGLDVEYWQVRIIEVVTGTMFYGNSNWNFIRAEAPVLTPTEWDQTMTDYLSAWTGRNSYGVGPTEKVMIENALSALYN